MLGLILGLVILVLGIIALIKDVLDLYVVVGVGFILIGAWAMFGSREYLSRS